MIQHLWTPEHIEDLLLVTIDPHEATESEWTMMQILNEAALQWTSGAMDTDTYCDILHTAGFDPIDFICTAQNHVDKLIRTT